MNPFGLADRVAVVTGAGSGIGRQAAITFADAGARVVLVDVDEAAVAATAQTIGAAASTQVVDVRDRAGVQAVADHTVEVTGRLDVWANVAGILRSAPVVELTETALDEVIAVNLKGVFWGCAAAARAMPGPGSIVNIASAGADLPAPGLAAYAATKAAVLMLTRTLAHELGPRGIRVNAIAPGFIDTPMVAGHYRRPDGSVDEERRRAVFESRARGSPLGRIGEPIDVAYAMLYLAADASRFVTGQTLRPNGGVVMP
jgi:3-oxoacyl-[acyl-carrier protein] reductase